MSHKKHPKYKRIINTSAEKISNQVVSIPQSSSLPHRGHATWFENFHEFIMKRSEVNHTPGPHPNMQFYPVEEDTKREDYLTQLCPLLEEKSRWTSQRETEEKLDSKNCSPILRGSSPMVQSFPCSVQHSLW